MYVKSNVAIRSRVESKNGSMQSALLWSVSFTMKKKSFLAIKKRVEKNN